MADIDVALLDRLLKWEARLAEGDRSLDAWALAALAEDARAAAMPVMFYAPRGRVALEMALAAGLDLTRRRSNGDTVLFEADLHDLDAYRCAADVFAAKAAIDWVNADGLTALSCQVKFGRIEKARLLLERGACPNAVMRNPRYGGEPLSVAQQAVMAMGAQTDPEAEAFSIDLLALLRAHGLSVARAERDGLLARAAARPKVASWLREHLDI